MAPPERWTSCETLLDEARSSLSSGGMIHGSDFDLYAAMSAVELMEPLMDAGARRIQDEAAESTRRKKEARDLSTKEICDVCDRWMVEEAQWLAGHTLAQTVFLCDYACEPDSIEGTSALGAYCIAARACDALIDRVVVEGGMVGDEDFIIETFGLPIHVQGEDPERVLVELDNAQKRANRPEEAPLRKRLKLRASLLQALILLTQPKSSGCEEARHFLRKARLQLQDISEEVDEEAIARAPGYSLHAKARLTAPLPPRAAPLHDIKACFEYLNEFLITVEEASRVHEHGRSLLQLERWLYKLARKNKPVVAMAFAAGAMRLDLPDGLGWNTAKELIQLELMVPMDAVLETEKGKEFFEEAGKCLTDHLISCCSNHARQHRLSRRYLEDFSVLLNLALAVEDERKADVQTWMKESGIDPGLVWAQRPFTSWTSMQVTRVQIMMLFKGFELDLYSEKEYCMIYWYIEYLLRCLLSALQAYGEAYMQCKNHKGMPRLPSRGQKKKGKVGVFQSAAFDNHGLQGELTNEVLEVQAVHALCQGLFHMMAYLHISGKLLTSTPPFNTERERFEQRFGCLHLCQSPIPLVYPQFLDAMSRFRSKGEVTDPSRACAIAQQSFQLARSYLQRLPDPLDAGVKAMDRVAASNLLTLAVLERARTQTPSTWDDYFVSFNIAPGDARFRSASLRTKHTSSE